MQPLRRCRSARALADDFGSAAVEFVTAGVLLLVPMVYLVLAVAAIQAGSFAVEGASRQAARVYVESPDGATADNRASSAIAVALADFGLSDRASTVSVTCSPQPHDCLHRRGFVTVRVRASVALPLAPTAITVHAPLAITLEATTTEQVSRFWSGG
jgi:Flp pilus assembly protein TadG